MNKTIDDLISRTVLIDELMAGCMPLDLPGLSGVTGDKLTIRNYIDSAPTVDVAPVVHGLWIYFHCARNGLYQCSECFHWVDEKTDRNYCPNCGAKMENNK